MRSLLVARATGRSVNMRRPERLTSRFHPAAWAAGSSYRKRACGQHVVYHLPGCYRLNGAGGLGGREQAGEFAAAMDLQLSERELAGIHGTSATIART